MKEINDIICAYADASLAGKKTALATVVHVEGSSYRRPGARMLVTEEGMLTGAISGGCLEGDALRKALMAINENKNKLVTYDTTDEDDAKFGVQLGCNGIVHILFEPINDQIQNNPLQLLKRVVARRRNTVLVTLFSLQSKDLQPGTCYFKSSDEIAENTSYGTDTVNKYDIHNEAETALLNQNSVIKKYDSAPFEITAFLELLQPPVALVICGAGNDAIPLAAAGLLAGWDITVIDGRPTHATKQRFPKVNKLIVAKAENILNSVNMDERTVWVLMTHNYNYDLEVLRQLSQTACKYIGILGPKKKYQRMIEELKTAGTFISNSQQKRIYSPVGLDIGAETAEEIALSIAAEIKAVLSGRNAKFLRDKLDAIHERSEKIII